MNLYNLHKDTSNLKHKPVAKDHVPQLFWEKYKKDHDKLKKHEDAIATVSEYALYYAEFVLKGPFPKGEAAIAKDAYYSGLYKELTGIDLSK